MKRLFLMVVIATAFVSTTVAHNTGTPMPTKFNSTPTNAFIPGCRCDSVIVLDDAEMDYMVLSSLQEIIPALDSIGGVLDETLESEAYLVHVADSLEYIKEVRSKFFIDSMVIGGRTDTALINYLFSEIRGAAATIEQAKFELPLVQEARVMCQDVYYAMAFPARLLFKVLLGDKLKNPNLCCNAAVYYHGKQVFTLKHYVRYGNQ